MPPCSDEVADPVTRATKLLDQADVLARTADRHRQLRDEHDVQAERFYEESQATRGRALEILRGIAGMEF